MKHIFAIIAGVTIGLGVGFNNPIFITSGVISFLASIDFIINHK